ncbi:hypothetical protein Ahy_A03g013514 isoform B [Arachis hypogaea]|uniref:Uncharacterized protein n=1 Tax=Arachis hypogaea TaxID=3818 RepID=A0A445DVL5_ARAHY|nr:hypothetical protein Ahy_A03g013514 isoform B [Arachis hypogaea]
MTTAALSSYCIIMPLLHLSSLQVRTITALITSDLSKDIFGTASLITATTMSPIEAYRRLPAPMIRIHINWRAPLLEKQREDVYERDIQQQEEGKGLNRGTPEHLAISDVSIFRSE